MTINVIVPSMGESIVDATVVHWYKKEGDPVANGEKLVELETDKVNLDVGAEKAGVLTRIDHPEGDDVRVGDVLALIDEKAAANAPNEPAQPSEPAQPASGSREDRTTTSEPVLIQPQPQAPAQRNNNERERVTPVARRIAEEMGIDTGQVAPSRPGARITKQDVEQYAGRREAPSEAVPKPVQTIPPAPIPAPPPRVLQQTDREERQILSRRRRTIAQRLVEAQHSAAMLTTFNDVDMTEIMNIRQRRKEEFKQKSGVGMGITSFFVKATIHALKSFPQVNSEIQGDEIIIKHYYDIGIAIGDEEGLVVPVIRNADQLSFVEIEKQIQTYVTKSREGSLTIEDLRGGTFTITNGGVFGSLFSTPILNAPQVGILGLHRIEERPIAKDGQVVVRPMMYLALSYDHRVIDGREAVQFLAKIKNVIENPELLWLEG